MGTTKNVVLKHLSDLQKWAEATKAIITADPALQAMAGKDELPENSPVWADFTKQADDPVFQKFLDMSGLARRLMPAEGAEANVIRFERFLEQMSKTMVTAQRQLDEESGQYLAQVAADEKKRHVLPSIFRVPKLSAQMKFALDVQQQDSLNLIFFRHDQTTASRNEQAINFDIVSIPAPPEAAAAVKAIGPRLDLVLDPFERTRVLDSIRATTPASGLEPIIAAATSTPEQVLLLGLMRENQLQRYVVLFADPSPEADEHAVGMWLASFPDAGGASLTTVYRLTRKNGPGEGPLKEVVLAVAAVQKNFLAG